MKDALLVGEKKGREKAKSIKRQDMLQKGLCEDVYPREKKVIFILLN